MADDFFIPNPPLLLFHCHATALSCNSTVMQLHCHVTPLSCNSTFMQLHCHAAPLSLNSTVMQFHCHETPVFTVMQLHYHAAPLSCHAAPLQGWGQVQLTKYSSTPSTTNIYQVQVLVKYSFFLKKYLSTSSTFIPSTSTSTHIKICSKVRMDIQSRVNFG